MSRMEDERRNFLKLGSYLIGGTLISGLLGFKWWMEESREGIYEGKMGSAPTDPPSQPEPTSTRKPPEVAPKQTELARLVEKYGPAQGVPVFEFHGDSYRMFSGLYEMNPETFKSQMEWLRKHEFHAVTGLELCGFLDGNIELPSRSVILSTDSGVGSVRSMPRVLEVLRETGMHMQSYIWTRGMNDEAWDMFREILKTGLVTIGTHSTSHDDLATYSFKQGLRDLLESKELIEKELSIAVYGISWPLESYPDWAPKLKDHGFEYGLAGWSRERAKLAVYKNDPQRFNLPRIFPPNPNGKSGRPGGLSLSEIMTLFTGQEFEELE